MEHLTSIELGATIGTNKTTHTWTAETVTEFAARWNEHAKALGLPTLQVIPGAEGEDAEPASAAPDGMTVLDLASTRIVPSGRQARVIVDGVEIHVPGEGYPAHYQSPCGGKIRVEQREDSTVLITFSEAAPS